MDFNRSAEEEEQLKALRRQRFSNTEGEKRYKQLVEARAKRREQLVAQGRLGRGGSLSAAIKIVGTCTLMCPEFEREERELKKNLAPQEIVPGTRTADPQRTVKTFHRSAAGNEEPLPEDLRTPDTLIRTLDYLVDAVIGGDQSLRSCHGFVRDRTRSIRQDFTIQNVRDHRTMAACERIARFHIVSLHVLCGHKEFEEQQDMEQLRNTLKTLIELYDDRRKAGEPSPNEAEFYAYYVVAHLRDSDSKRVAERLPAHIFGAPVVQQALRLHMMSESSGVVTSRQDPGNQFAAQNLATQFFRAVASPKTPFLLACLAEYRFPSIRRAALKAMNAAFPYQEGKEYPGEEFAAMLAFDSVNELTEFCALFNVAVDHRGVRLGERAGKQLVFREPDQKLRRSGPNLRVVGAKLHSSLMHVINTPLDQNALAPARLVTSARPAAQPPSLQHRLSVQKPAFPQANPFGQPAATATNNATSGFNATLGACPSSVSAAAARFGSSQNAAQPLAFKSASQPAAFASGMQAKQDTSSPFPAFAAGARKPAKSVSFAPTLVTGTSESGFTTPAKSQQSGFAAPANHADVAVAAAATPSPLSVSAPSTLFPSLSATVAQPNQSAAQTPVSLFSASPAKPALAPPAANPLYGSSFLTPETKQQQQQQPLPPQQAVQGSPAAEVVWNRPRMRINWTSLTNTLYADLIESLVGEVGQPIIQRAQKHSNVALALSEDIAEAIISYTSAFMVYEESYRCLLFAQADSFRRRSALGRAFSRWSMESVAKQQDRALQQQYMDELDRMVDSEYIGQKQAFSSTFSSPMTRTPAISRGLANSLDTPGTLVGTARAASLPADFWESLHLGRENFDSVCRMLKRYGSPSLESVVELSGAHDMSVLSSWLWWQMDPSTVSTSSQSTRSAVYSKAYRQRKSISMQRIEVREADNNSDDDDDGRDVGLRRISAIIVLLSSEPVTSNDLKGDLDSTPLGTQIRALVNGSLDRIRRQASQSHTHESIPILNVFWCSDSRTAKAVRRFVEYVVSENGVPSNVAMHTLALDVMVAKKQLGVGIKWLFRQIAQSRRGLLVRVSRAYDPVVGSMLQMLGRLRNCVAGILDHRAMDEDSDMAVFNKAVDVANAFIHVVNQYLLVDSQLAAEFPKANTQTGIGWAYFGTLPFVADAVARASLDEILFGRNRRRHSCPELTSCLAALEFAAKHQMGFIQHSIPTTSTYVDRHEVAEAAETATNTAEQLVVQTAQLCQQMTATAMEEDQTEPVATPRPKRPSSLAFGEFIEPLPPVAGLFGPPSPNTTASFRTTSVASEYSDSVQNSPMLSASKRQRPDSSSSRLSRLQMAISRARKQLDN
ncbi:actin cytoskeleton and mitosis protein [Coemansia sp. RSA 485]|nr:actin cytoskeleton and mitosis protein [Coemansia sp. RSA 485]